METFDPRCRASIRTQYGPLWARCILGSDLLRPRPVIADGPGLLGAAIYAAISSDQPVTRSHPNKAVDITFIAE
jgi:hypothetical protein